MRNKRKNPIPKRRKRVDAALFKTYKKLLKCDKNILETAFTLVEQGKLSATEIPDFIVKMQKSLGNKKRRNPWHSPKNYKNPYEDLLYILRSARKNFKSLSENNIKDILLYEKFPKNIFGKNELAEILNLKDNLVDQFLIEYSYSEQEALELLFNKIIKDFVKKPKSRSETKDTSLSWLPFTKIDSGSQPPKTPKTGLTIIDEALRRRRRNPEMALSARLFQAPLKEYTNWPEKWWREVIQNSVDAGATEIECYVDIIPEGVWATIQDNGGGMTQDILLNKFLVFGETTKEGATGTTGGFGKAKELILLPWLKWEITTQDTTIKGVANKYEISKADEPIKGTKLSVLMAKDSVANFDLAASSFIKKCYLPKVTFTVNGKSVAAEMETGNLVDEKNQHLKIYWNQDKKISESSPIIVRINGIFMFDDYISSKLEGTLVVELIGTSVELLTTNREGLSKQEDRYYYRNFIGRLEKDVRSGLKGAGNRVRKIYKGSGKFDVYAKDAIVDDLAEMVKDIGHKKHAKDETNTLDLQDIEKLVKVIKELEADKASLPEKVIIHPDDTVTNLNGELIGVCKGNVIYNLDGSSVAEIVGTKVLGENKITSYTGTPQHDDPGKVIGGTVSTELAQALLNNLEVTNGLEEAIKQLAWEPDFFLVNEIKDFKVPADFTPEAMTTSIRRIARLWAELCRFTLIQLGCSRKFGVGFIFSHSSDGWVAAEYDREAGEHWILVNPYLKGDPANDIYNINDERHLDELYALAIHECTHIADNIAYHDEDFSSALTRNIARTIRGRKNLRAIRDSIKTLYPKGPGVSKKTLGEVRTFYKIVKPGKGRPALFEKLLEARKYIDTNYRDVNCKIVGMYLPEGITDRKHAIEIGEIETRKDGVSYLDEIQEGLGIEASIQDSLERADELLVNLLKHEADIGLWQRKNPSISCPSQKLLDQLCLWWGPVDDIQREDLIEHIRTCKKCQEEVVLLAKNGSHWRPSKSKNNECCEPFLELAAEFNTNPSDLDEEKTGIIFQPISGGYTKEAESGYAQFANKINLLWYPVGNNIHLQMQQTGSKNVKRFVIKNDPQNLYRPWKNQYIIDALSEMLPSRRNPDDDDRGICPVCGGKIYFGQPGNPHGCAGWDFHQREFFEWEAGRRVCKVCGEAKKHRYACPEPEGWRKNPDRLRELEKTSFETKNAFDTAKYWHESLRKGMLPKPFKNLQDYAIWSLTGRGGNYVVSVRPDANHRGLILSKVNGRDEQDVYRSEDQRQLLVAAHLNLILEDFENQLIENPTVDNIKTAETWLANLKNGQLPKPNVVAKNSKAWVLDKNNVSLITDYELSRKKVPTKVKYLIVLKLKNKMADKIYAYSIKKAEQRVKEYLELLLNEYLPD